MCAVIFYILQILLHWFQKERKKEETEVHQMFLSSED